jgi:hypothetical protein
MSDHEELADAQEELVARMDRESERVSENTDDARSRLEQANSDGTIPHSLGRQDPAYRESAPTDEEDDHEGDDLASAEGPSGDETDADREEPQGDDQDRGDETP